MRPSKNELLTAIVEGIKSGTAVLGWSEDMFYISIELNGEEVRVRSDNVSAKYHVYNADDCQLSEYYFRDITDLYLDLDPEGGELQEPVGFSEEDERILLNVVNDHTPTVYYFDDGREADGYLGAELVFDPYADGEALD